MYDFLCSDKALPLPPPKLPLVEDTSVQTAHAEPGDGGSRSQGESYLAVSLTRELRSQQLAAGLGAHEAKYFEALQRKQSQGEKEDSPCSLHGHDKSDIGDTKLLRNDQTVNRPTSEQDEQISFGDGDLHPHKEEEGGKSEEEEMGEEGKAEEKTAGGDREGEEVSQAHGAPHGLEKPDPPPTPTVTCEEAATQTEPRITSDTGTNTSTHEVRSVATCTDAVRTEEVGVNTEMSWVELLGQVREAERVAELEREHR